MADPFYPPPGYTGLPPSGQPAPMQDGEFEAARRNFTVHVAHCEIDPPISNYVDADDRLVLNMICYSTARTVTATVRLLMPHGGVETIQLVLTNPSALVATTSTQLREGYILSASITTANLYSLGAPNWCSLSIQRGAPGVTQQARVLCAGQVRPQMGISFPDRALRTPLDENPALVSQNAGAVGAGIDWTYTLPANLRASIVSVSAQLATSATVATRTAALKVTDGANTLALIDATATQLASLTDQYSGYGNGFPGGTGGTHLYWPLPSPLILANGWTIGTLTANIQAADQWSNIYINMLQWLDVAV